MAAVNEIGGHKRYPFAAAALSLLFTGLGHWYCGRIKKGLVFSFLSVVFLPVFMCALLVSNSSLGEILGAAAVAGAAIVSIVAVVDSYYIAKQTRPDYQLKDYNRWYLYLLVVLTSMATSFGTSLNFRSNLIEAFRVPSASMYPTIKTNDRILANKLAYKSRDPKRGDVVVFIYPENRRFNYVKRIVAVAGDTVEIKNNEVFINGQKLERTGVGQATLHKKKADIAGQVFSEKNGEAEYKIFFADTDTDQEDKITDFAQITVPKNHCFVLADNRNCSRDSRHFGAVHLGLIKGRADYLYWPAEGWAGFGRIK